MNPSFDDGSASMTSVDLLSPTTSIDQGDTNIRPSQSNLEQISEENNAEDQDKRMLLSQAPPDDLFDTAPMISPSSSEPAAHLNQYPHEHDSSTASPNTASGVDPPTVYQIDFDVEHLGKNKPSSKRMAIWKYGIPHNNKIAEHEAKLIWSTHSGKYTISVDGEAVYSNIAKGSVLEHKWHYSHSRGTCVEKDDEGCKDGIAMRIIACRKPPTRSSKNFRCYEFLIGGKVFRDLPVHSENGSQNHNYREEFENEESLFNEGKLMSILDVIEPGWRAAGFA